MMLSALHPRFRDTGIIWSVAVTALFYATPVLYPLEIVSGALAELLALNPLAPMFELARKWVIDPERARARRGRGRRGLAARSRLAIFVAICLLAVWIFKREAPRIAEEL